MALSKAVKLRRTFRRNRRKIPAWRRQFMKLESTLYTRLAVLKMHLRNNLAAQEQFPDMMPYLESLQRGMQDNQASFWASDRETVKGAFVFMQRDIQQLKQHSRDLTSFRAAQHKAKNENVSPQ